MPKYIKKCSTINCEAVYLPYHPLHLTSYQHKLSLFWCPAGPSSSCAEAAEANTLYASPATWGWKKPGGKQKKSLLFVFSSWRLRMPAPDWQPCTTEHCTGHYDRRLPLKLARYRMQFVVLAGLPHLELTWPSRQGRFPICLVCAVRAPMVGVRTETPEAYFLRVAALDDS